MPNEEPETIQGLVLQTREIKQQRQLVKNKCWALIREKLANVSEECGVAWNGPDAGDCEVEKKIMREHVEVLEHGVYMALVIFGTLRLTAHPRFEPFANAYIKPFFRLTPPKQKVEPPRSKNFNRRNNPRLDRATKEPKMSDGTGKSFRRTTHLEQKRELQVERVHNAVEPFFDLMVSLICGLSAVFFFTRPAQIRMDFEDAPLCPGRSIWCEHMCDDFIEIMQETDPKLFEFGEEKVDANLVTFQKFALHCTLRAAHIQKRRQEGETKPTVLPTSVPWEKDQDGSASETA